MEQNITNILLSSNRTFSQRQKLQNKNKDLKFTSKKAENDSFTKTKQDTNNKKYSKKILGSILVAAGIIIAVVIAIKKQKIAKINKARPQTNPIDYEKEKQAAIDSARKKANSQYAAMQEQFDEQAKRQNEQIIIAQEYVREANEQVEKATKYAREYTRYVDETIAKDKEHAKKIQQEFDEFNERMKKEEEKFRKSYDRYKEDSQKHFEDYWEQTKRFYEEFYSRNSTNLSRDKIIRNAKDGIKLFRQYGQDNSGNIYEEIAKMDSIENLTPEIVKKAHHRLVKKYFPLINTGTKKEKEDATRIMQELNPASDAIRLYLGIK